MRIVTWNCQMGLDKKVDALLSTNPDVAMIPECAEKSVAECRKRGLNTLWFGSNPSKGVGLVCRQDWPLRALPQPEQKWIVPIGVKSPVPFTLIAVWAHAAGACRADRYIGQVYQALVAHPEWFDGNPVVGAGDFRLKSQILLLLKSGNHSDVVKLLRERGLVSAYHEIHGEAQGNPNTGFPPHLGNRSAIPTFTQPRPL